MKKVLIKDILRINFDVNCIMDFRMYPVDKQECIVQIDSFAHQTSQVKHEKILDLFFLKRVGFLILAKKVYF